MKVFTHGSTNNFQESAREMFISDLDQLISTYQENEKVILGTINLEQGEVHLFGTLHGISFDSENNQCEVHFSMLGGEERRVPHSYEELIISHDATFDLYEEDDQQVTYQVVYVTFRAEDSDKETTYFLAKEAIVSEPVSCAVEFWQQVSQVGRDADFKITGCRTKAFSE